MAPKLTLLFNFLYIYIDIIVLGDTIELSTFQVVADYFDDEEAFSDKRPNNHVIRIWC
jgi:hypothetical protein